MDHFTHSVYKVLISKYKHLEMSHKGVQSNGHVEFDLNDLKNQY